MLTSLADSAVFDPPTYKRWTLIVLYYSQWDHYSTKVNHSLFSCAGATLMLKQSLNLSLVLTCVVCAMCIV